MPRLFFRRWTLTTIFAVYGVGAAVLLTVPVLGHNAWTVDHTNVLVPHVSAGVIYQLQGCQPGNTLFFGNGNDPSVTAGEPTDETCTMRFSNRTSQDISWAVTPDPSGALENMWAPPYGNEFAQTSFGTGTFAAMSGSAADSTVIVVIFTTDGYCPVTLNVQATDGGAFQAQIPLAC